MKTTLTVLKAGIPVLLALSTLKAADYAGDYNFLDNVSFVNNITINAVGSQFGNETVGYNTGDCLFVGSFGNAATGTFRAINSEANFTGVSPVTSSTATFTGVNGIARTDTNSTASLTISSSGGALRNRFGVVVGGTGLVGTSSAVSAYANITNATGTMTMRSISKRRPPSSPTPAAR